MNSASTARWLDEASIGSDLEERAHLALFIFGLSGGGAQRRTVTLANGFAERGHRVDLVVVRANGPIPPSW